MRPIQLTSALRLLDFCFLICKSTEGRKVNKIRKGGLWNLVSETNGEVFGGIAGNEDPEKTSTI